MKLSSQSNAHIVAIKTQSKPKRMSASIYVMMHIMR